jgi:hypothetical protein
MTSTLISNIVIAMKEVSGSYVNSMDTSKEFELEGFKYRILSQEDRTVEIVGFAEAKESEQLKIHARILVNDIIYTVVAIGQGAFERSNFTSILMPPTITIIGKRAFCWCRALKSLVIPNSVTHICESAFSDCSGLTSIEIPDSVMCIEGGVFWGCRLLTYVEIPNSVTEIGEDAFSGCLDRG